MKIADPHLLVGNVFESTTTCILILWTARFQSAPIEGYGRSMYIIDCKHGSLQDIKNYRRSRNRPTEMKSNKKDRCADPFPICRNTTGYYVEL